MSNFSTAWKTGGSSKAWTDELLGVPSTLQITVDKTQETWHSASLQALPWFRRYSQPHLSPNDLLTKVTSNFFTVGRNDTWGVNNAPMHEQAAFLRGIKHQPVVRVGCCSHTSLRCSLFFKGMADSRVKKWNTQKKLFKSKLNPINDSFKRSVPYIYKSTLMGLCAIWLLTFAVSQNTVQAAWVLTSSLKTLTARHFDDQNLSVVTFGLNCVEPTKALHQVQWHRSISQTCHWQVSAFHGVRFHALLFYIFITSCYIINSDYMFRYFRSIKTLFTYLLY